MGLIEKCLPKTDNFFYEGFKLALVDLVFLAGSGVIAFAVFSLVDIIRRIGIPIPLPVWLVSLFLVIPYYVFSFEYGRSYGSKNNKRRLYRGFLVGIVGHLPNFILLFVMIQGEFHRYFDPQIWKIVFTMFGMLSIVAPIMVTLGAVDVKQK
ncbi:MAG: hypothetical protein GX041_08155 [Clostridiales bacterium]|jgi:uncharacterized membrane protein|nr:hypothetical protein [Clostridiales bacterium]